MQILDLPDAHLSGTLPPAVGYAWLDKTVCAFQSFERNSPEEIGLMRDLRNLYLNDMFLSGTLPDMSGCLATRGALDKQ